MKLFRKKMISALLACVFILSVHVPAMAAETDAEMTDGLFIITEEVPAEAVEYAKNNIALFVNSFENHVPLDTMTIGQPFALRGYSCSLYYFLVYDNGKLAGSLRVYQEYNGEYAGIYSPQPILSGLTSLTGVTTPDSPARLVVGKYDGLYAVVDGNVLTIEESRESNITDFNYVLQKSNMTYRLNEHVVNAAASIDLSCPSAQNAFSNNKYLMLPIAETQQTDQKWCSAYATAAIIRYRLGLEDNRTVSAKIIMQYTFPNETSESLNQKSLSLDNAVKYAKTYRINPQKANSTLSYSMVQSEINADRPIYFAADNITTGKSSHAFVCRGYSENFYSVWNPWYKTCESMPASSNTYTTDQGTKYQWTKTIYNWK